MIQAFTDMVSAITGLGWLTAVICLMIYLRRPIINLAENVANADKGRFEVSPQRVNVEWERSIVTAAVNLTAAAIKKDQAEQELPRIVNSVVTAANGAAVAGKYLLWVDDQPGNNTYAIKALESQRINVVTSTSTREALEQFKTYHFAVVVTDQLRIEDGTEDHEAGTHLLEAVQKLGLQIPVILSTAFPNKLEAQQRGFFDATNTQCGVYELIMKAIKDRTTTTTT